MRSEHAEANVRRSGGSARRRVFAVTACVLALSVAAGAGGAAARPAKTKTPVPAVALTAALKYVGGKAGKANPNLSPVSIGWVSDETALTGHPGNTDGADAAVALINNNLGGVDGGHPVKLVSCPITSTDAQGASCAQVMLNRSDVKVVAEGELLTGESSFIGTMAGKKPVIGVFTHGTGADPNAFYLDGAIQAQLASVSYLVNNVHVKTVSVLGPDLPGVSSALGKFQALFAAHGVQATVVLYPNAASDVTAPIAASGAANADGIFLVSSTSDECIAIAKAFTQLGIDKPVVSLPECLEPAVKTGLGDYPKWTYVFTSKNPSQPFKPNSQLAAFVAAMTSYSNPEYVNNGYAPLTFGTILTIAKWMNELGKPKFVTSAAIAAKAAAFTGPMYLGDAKLVFGQAPYPDIGSIRALFYTYKGNNAFNEVSGGQWICPPITASGCTAS
jgi:branched-chain amino acid transport system substrate-binding protein